MTIHMVFSEKSIQKFDLAWKIFLRVSVVVFGLIVAAPMIKTAVVYTAEAWMVVPGIFAVSALGFFLLTLVADDLRNLKTRYNPWMRRLAVLGWWNYPECLFEEKLLARQVRRTMKEDLHTLRTIEPGLAKTICKIEEHEELVRERDVIFIAKRLNRHGLICQTMNLNSPENQQARMAYIDKATRRLGEDWLEKQLDD